MRFAEEHRFKAACLALFAIGITSTQDAIVKSLASALPAYEVVLIRGLVGLPILATWLFLTDGFKSLFTPFIWPLLGRGLVLSAAYYSFIMAIAAMPIANAVAIYFTMLAGPFLGEHVPVYRWLAIAAAFVGVLVIVQPGRNDFEPASGFALFSALGYAVGQMMGRHYSQQVPPVAIANVQNLMYLIVSILLLVLINMFGFQGHGYKSLNFLFQPLVWPTGHGLMLLGIMGVLGSIGSVVFTYAYKFAQASFVAPFEYVSMFWAVAFGFFLFGDFPAPLTWAGMAIVIAAGLFMTWRDLQKPAHGTG
jgi:drug/metabolite transporter (DMT)-like permease